MNQDRATISDALMPPSSTDFGASFFAVFDGLCFVVFSLGFSLALAPISGALCMYVSCIMYHSLGFSLGFSLALTPISEALMPPSISVYG